MKMNLIVDNLTTQFLFPFWDIYAQHLCINEAIDQPIDRHFTFFTPRIFEKKWETSQLMRR